MVFILLLIPALAMVKENRRASVVISFVLGRRKFRCNPNYLCVALDKVLEWLDNQ
jgi:hypothetical protein